MKRVMTLIALGAASLAAPALVPNSTTVAYAQSGESKAIVDKALEDGVIGETIDGYLAVVEASASETVRDAMNDINIRRKSLYTERARETGATPKEYGRVIGEKQVQKAKDNGWFYMDESLVWKRT